jgi:flagellar basal-body rod modification protein FlgD
MDVASLTSGGTSQSAQAGKSLSSNFDTFLKLLTTQLQNQDPLEPMDSSEFTKQLVQYSGVEQSIYTNQNLEKLIGLQQTASLGSAVSYLGREATAPGNLASLSGGQAQWSYTLPAGAASVAVTVTDAQGRVLYSGEAPNNAGEQSFVWNGRTASGATAPDGLYRIRVDARDANGQALTPVNFVRGAVTGAEMTKDGVLLTIGGVPVKLEDVTSVRAAPQV